MVVVVVAMAALMMALVVVVRVAVVGQQEGITGLSRNSVEEVYFCKSGVEERCLMRISQEK